MLCNLLTGVVATVGVDRLTGVVSVAVTVMVMVGVDRFTGVDSSVLVLVVGGYSSSVTLMMSGTIKTSEELAQTSNRLHMLTCVQHR
jgi:hypothetical protein